MVYVFKKLVVYGVSIPSTLAVDAVTENVDDESLKVITQASKEWVNSQNMITNPNILAPDTLYFELSKLFEQRYKILESVEASLNLSSEYYIKSKFVMSWHVSVRGTNNPWDTQKYSRIASKISKGFKDVKFNNQNNISYPQIDFTQLTQYRDSILQRLLIEELVEAANYVDKFHIAFLSVANERPDIGRLYVRVRKIEKQWFDITNKYKQDLNPIYPYKCPFCGVRKWVDRGVRIPRTCGSDECKLAYIRANRKKNHPKRGWVHDPTALKPCIGGCGSNRKNLNSERLCFACYKSFS